MAAAVYKICEYEEGLGSNAMEENENVKLSMELDGFDFIKRRNDGLFNEDLVLEYE